MRLTATLFFASVLAACSPQPVSNGPAAPPQPSPIDAPSGEYTLDPNHTSVVIRANHFGLSNYPLRLTVMSGALNFNAEDPIQSSVSVTIAANSVQTAYPGERSFDDELENSEWLDAANYPNLTFVSTDIELTGANTGRMTGDLTIRGVTHPATFDVTFNRAYRQHPMGRPMALLGFSASARVKRSDYGMNVLLPASSGGIGVADEVDVQIEAEFTQPAAPPNPTN